MTSVVPKDRRMVVGRILVVDDQEPNRMLLQELLEAQGHEVVLAENGPDALRLVAENQPDLLLLDVNMPRMNGLEVCRQLRSDPAAESLPIILVTALADREHRLEGIGAGASDYLTKPIDRADLLLRVRNALTMRKLHRELAARYHELKRLEELRDNLVHMVVHDLRSPLTGITVYLGLMREEVQQLSHPTLLADLDETSEQVKRLTEMVSNVLDVSRLEAGAMPLRRAPVDLSALAEEAIASVAGRRQAVAVDFRPPGDPIQISVDVDVVRRIIANLVANALKFTPNDGQVRVEVGAGSDGPEVRIIDTGPGIPPAYHEKIFEKFGQAETAGRPLVGSSGLGLAFCRLAVEAHGGRIGVTSDLGKGSTFWFTLPTHSESGAADQALSRPMGVDPR